VEEESTALSRVPPRANRSAPAPSTAVTRSPSSGSIRSSRRNTWRPHAARRPPPACSPDAAPLTDAARRSAPRRRASGQFQDASQEEGEIQKYECGSLVVASVAPASSGVPSAAAAARPARPRFISGGGGWTHNSCCHTPARARHRAPGGIRRHRGAPASRRRAAQGAREEDCGKSERVDRYTMSEQSA
jgi:hypothetical protein